MEVTFLFMYPAESTCYLLSLDQSCESFPYVSKNGCSPEDSLQSEQATTWPAGSVFPFTKVALLQEHMIGKRGGNLSCPLLGHKLHLQGSDAQRGRQGPSVLPEAILCSHCGLHSLPVPTTLTATWLSFHRHLA